MKKFFAKFFDVISYFCISLCFFAFLAVFLFPDPDFTSMHYDDFSAYIIFSSGASFMLLIDSLLSAFFEIPWTNIYHRIFKRKSPPPADPE